MEALIIVVALIASATFITGLLLPLGTRHSRRSDGPSPEDLYEAQLAVGSGRLDATK